MKIEVMIYAYGAICISMIFFNIAYNIALKGSEPRLKKRCFKLRILVDEHIIILKRDGDINQNYLEPLQNKLQKINELIAFDRVLDELLAEDEDIAKKYIGQLEPLLLRLAGYYIKKEDMQVGYYSYFLTKHIRTDYMSTDSIREILLSYVRKENLYCRVNALSALYAIGNPYSVLEALKIQDDNKVFLHEKILTEGLLTYTGDSKVLSRMLWENFETFSVHTQLAIMNYIRFHTDGFEEGMFNIMLDERRDKELRLSAIRYFGRYAYRPALPVLIEFSESKNPDMWEYATVSAGSLYRYSDIDVIDDVIKALKNALYSSNWHVRYAASQSLESFNLTYDELIDLLAGKDRYVREMVNYRLEHRRIQESAKANDGRN